MMLQKTLYVVQIVLFTRTFLAAFHGGDEVVDPVVDPVMSQRILVTLSETIQLTRTFCFMKYVVRY
jgi:hypothetical protein